MAIGKYVCGFLSDSFTVATIALGLSAIGLAKAQHMAATEPDIRRMLQEKDIRDMARDDAEIMQKAMDNAAAKPVGKLPSSTVQPHLFRG